MGKGDGKQVKNKDVKVACSVARGDPDQKEYFAGLKQSCLRRRML